MQRFDTFDEEQTVPLHRISEDTDPIVIVTPLPWRPVVMPKRLATAPPVRPRWAEGVVLRRPR